MVLSNKKLKQKLRAELADSLASSELNANAQTQPHSLKLLLDSASQRPRFSKREKRRENISVRGSLDPIGRGGEGESDETMDKKKKKKRKREEEGNTVVSKSETETELEVKNPKKKKKAKKNKKKKKKGKDEEKKKVNEIENDEKMVLETNEKSDFSEANGELDTKVYVGGIPYYSTEDDIRSFFESCGSITEVDCMIFPETGKFRGIAIISFKTEAAAKRALALDGSDMGGLFLTIQPYKANRPNKANQTNKVSDFAPKIIDGYYRIYVGNLPWDITEDKLKNFFSDCKVSSLRFGNDKETGEFRGYAHVDFANSLSFTMALKLDQKVLCGRPVKISCAVPLKKEATDKAKTDQTNVPTITETADPSVAMTSIEPVVTDTLSSAVGTGKMRRRTCYECGEKGHISSDCPKNKTDTSTLTPPPPTTATQSTALQSYVPKATETTNYSSAPAALEPADANTGLSSVSAGKLRRRTCYECGEKGHVSSDCPKMQIVG